MLQAIKKILSPLVLTWSFSIMGLIAVVLWLIVTSPPESTENLQRQQAVVSLENIQEITEKKQIQNARADDEQTAVLRQKVQVAIEDQQKHEEMNKENTELSTTESQELTRIQKKKKSISDMIPHVDASPQITKFIPIIKVTEETTQVSDQNQLADQESAVSQTDKQEPISPEAEVASTAKAENSQDEETAQSKDENDLETQEASEDADSEAQEPQVVQRLDFNQNVSEPFEGSFLPITGPEQQKPYQVFSAKKAEESQDTRPKIAIVLVGVGMNEGIFSSLKERMPSEVTYALYPYVKEVQDKVRQIREQGHEFLLMVPMEPMRYPENDPGPKTLLTGLEGDANIKRLLQTLKQCTGYVGICNAQGSRFLRSKKDLSPVLKEVQGRGLLFAEMSPRRHSIAEKISREIKLPLISAHHQLDLAMTPDGIREQLQTLEDSAKKEGASIGYAYAYPFVVEAIVAWSKSLPSKDVRLVPVTQVL